MKWMEPCVRIVSHQGNDPLYDYKWAKEALWGSEFSINNAKKIWDEFARKYDLD